MPELPEVEVLVRHLRPGLIDKRIQRAEVRRERVIAPTTTASFVRRLRGARFLDVTRRGKFIVFKLQSAEQKEFLLLGHLGMTGRMFVVPNDITEPKHTAVVLRLGNEKF